MHPRQYIADLPVILRHKGVKHVVISPGSRNALLINSFFREFGKGCISIIDERSAAYVGLGMASFTKSPVVLLCTSGTAALNYAPAFAEAFHLGVPLIAITADRPPEWIDQQDNQTIRQTGIYADNIKADFSLPAAVGTEAEKHYVHRLINEAYNIAISGRPGPVHINVPLREPLYEEIPAAGEITCVKLTGSSTFTEPEDHLKKIWRDAKHILFVAGQQAFNIHIRQSINMLARDKRVCIIGEPASNIVVDGMIGNPELLLTVMENNHDLDPDLLLYFGGQVVSNRLKQFLRNCHPQHSWFIDAAGRHVDTFSNVTDIVQCNPEYFFNWLAQIENKDSTDYNQLWQERKKLIDNILKPVLVSIEFSDLGIMQRITAALPEGAILFAGNSSIIRYLGFFPPRCKEVYSNRGTSGIDGCVSTAVGIALASDDTVIALVGDQSFVYDSNALWNRSLPENLKIVVINNQGGGIFGLLDGPSSTPAFKSYLEAHHPVEIGKLTAAFGVAYCVCRNYDDFSVTFDTFVQQKGPAVFEIITPGEVNPVVFRNFVSHLKKPT
jgi:2-succinyl-5-enolpyruvyl-6-hydroxy-3-cyclohexene-1-carboxylate synthase